MDKGLDTKFAGKDETRPVPEGYETISFENVTVGDYVIVRFARQGGAGFFTQLNYKGYVLGIGYATGHKPPDGIRFIKIQEYGTVFSSEEPTVYRKKISDVSVGAGR